MKKRLLYLPVFLMIMSLCGCSPKLKTQNDTHEAGETLPTEVVDTTAPEGTFDSFFTVTNKEIHLDAFGLKAEDCSNFTVGFRKYELIKTEDELADIFQKALSESEEIQIAETLNLRWELEKDNWEEKNASSDSLKEEIVPEKDGLYRLEIAAVDVYGNATVMNSYALADTTAPVINGVEDKKIVIKKDTKLDNILTEGVSATDNLLGDITSYVSIKEEVIEGLDEEITGFKEKVIYTVADYFGNETVVECIVEAEFDKKSIVPEPQQTVVEQAAAADGFNEEWAYQLLNKVNEARTSIGLHPLVWDNGLSDFAKIRAKEASVFFSHTRPDGSSVMYGENLAGNARSVDEVFAGWMNSPGHRSNIEHPQCTVFGAACYSVNNKYTWVQIFY